MAKKTNFEVNGNKYFRVTRTVGHKADGTDGVQAEGVQHRLDDHAAANAANAADHRGQKGHQNKNNSSHVSFS